MTTISKWAVLTIFCIGQWTLLRAGSRLVLEWLRSRRSRSALAEADFGSPGESRAFEQLYDQCVKYREQTNSLDPGVVADAIERELPRLREAAARYREVVIRAHQEQPPAIDHAELIAKFEADFRQPLNPVVKTWIELHGLRVLSDDPVWALNNLAIDLKLARELGSGQKSKL